MAANSNVVLGESSGIGKDQQWTQSKTLHSYFGDSGRKSSLNSGYSRCGLWAGGVYIIWELVRNAVQRFGLHPRTTLAVNVF